MEKIKIAGFCSSHDCSYAILENGIPILHNELERFVRSKEPSGDGIEFMLNTYKDVNEIKHFTHCVDTTFSQYKETLNQLNEVVTKNGGKFHMPGHHASHAANAFFSSNFDEALIVTIDGGGRDYTPNGDVMITAFTFWEGKGNKIKEIEILPTTVSNIGWIWNQATSRIFGLSNGAPKGNQAGSVMAMACMGDSEKYFDTFYNAGFKDNSTLDYDYFKNIASKSEQDMFDVAAALQKATEVIIKEFIDKHIKDSHNYLCLSGGVVLNSVMVGKLYDWYPQIKDIYICPVPYDAGLAIGAAQYVWHQTLDNPRIKWEDNNTPYLGKTYDKTEVKLAINNFLNKIDYKEISDDEVVDLLSNNEGNVISVYGGGSESGRRALGNRSILADPRNPKMKDIINEKVKHRQWYRPFAPSILKEDTSDWFERDVNSPYMTAVIKFKEEVRDKVPAVCHFDGSARLQTVTEKDNKWYYNFIKKFKDKTNVPIVLNTSFNDREPIVETPTHAINCFLGTNIDYLYFRDFGIILTKK